MRRNFCGRRLVREEFIAFSRGLHVRMTNDTPIVVDSSLARVIFHSYRLSRSSVRVVRVVELVYFVL